MTEFSAWAVTTSAGIIVIDPLFDYSVGESIRRYLTVANECAQAALASVQ
jgi:hypothetical protein